MPNYELIIIETDLKPIAAKKENAEKAKKPIDVTAEVLVLLKKETKKSVENGKLLKEAVEAAHKEAKSALALMDQKFKEYESEPIPDIFKVPTIKAALDIIQVHLKTANDAFKDLMSAQAEWRGGWPANARPLVADPKSVEIFVALREKQINEQKTLIALRERIKEYVTRAEGIIKQAEGIGKDAKTSKEAVTEGNELSADIIKRAKATVELVYKDSNKLKTIEKTLSQAKIPDKEFSNVEGIYKHIESGLKNVKGAFKTLRMDVERLEKIAKPFAFIMSKTLKDTTTEMDKLAEVVKERDEAVTALAGDFKKAEKKKVAA